MTWQPIETAPMDGTPILLYKPNEKRMGQYIVAGYWNELWLSCGGRGLAYFSHLDQRDYGHPTHWQPLPEPPDAEE